MPTPLDELSRYSDLTILSPNLASFHFQVDGFMNVVMKEVEFYDAMRNRSKLDSFFVQNRLIRFVQIPTEIDIKSSMQELFNPNQRGSVL